VAADLVPVQIGHHDVEDNQVGLDVVDALQRLATVAGGRDLIADRRQRGRGDLQVECAIINDENACHGYLFAKPFGDRPPIYCQLIICVAP
jgi:hypothetical protein